MDILPLRCFWLEEFPQRISIRNIRLFPVFLNWIPSLAQAFLIRVAVLRDDGGDSLRVGQREAESNRGAVVEDIDCVPVKAELLSEAVDHRSQILECVAKLLRLGRIGKSKARKVRGHYVKAIPQNRNQVAE